MSFHSKNDHNRYFFCPPILSVLVIIHVTILETIITMCLEPLQKIKRKHVYWAKSVFSPSTKYIHLTKCNHKMPVWITGRHLLLLNGQPAIILRVTVAVFFLKCYLMTLAGQRQATVQGAWCSLGNNIYFSVNLFRLTKRGGGWLWHWFNSLQLCFPIAN